MWRCLDFDGASLPSSILMLISLDTDGVSLPSSILMLVFLDTERDVSFWGLDPFIISPSLRPLVGF